MSPRFERRPDKRTGAAGGRSARSGPSARPYSRDRRGESGSRGDRDRPGRSRDEWGGRGSERGRPGAGERSGEGAWSSARRVGSARPETRRFDRSRRDGGRPDAPRSTAGRSAAGRPERGRPTSLRRESAADPALATPEAERLGQPAPSDDLVWGRHAALAVLESGRPVHRIWCTPELRFSPKFLQQLREAKASGVLVEEVTWARLGQLTAGAVHQGIVLQTAAADTLDLDSLIEGCGGIGEAPLLMALDGITDPHNLGAIARSAEALGAHGLVLPQRRSAGLTGSVAKVAAGALEHLPVARVVNLNRALERLKQEGYRVVGLASEGSVSLEQADLDGPLVIVTGSEGDGLSMLTRRHCDQLVSIPLRGATPSLNASVASALLLYEVARRGWMHGLRGGDPAPRLLRPQLPAPPPSALPAAAGHDRIAEPAGQPDREPDAVIPPPVSAGDSVQAEVWAPAPATAEPGSAAPRAAEPETLGETETLGVTGAEGSTAKSNTAEQNTADIDPAPAAPPVSAPQPAPPAQPSGDPAAAGVPAFSADVDLGSLQL